MNPADLNLDAATLAARDRMLHELSAVRTADELWDLYRAAAIPVGAHPVQLVETRRAIFWAVSAVASLMGNGDGERLAFLIQSVQTHAEGELRAQLAQLGGV